jgi:hypothetical protein
MGFVAAPRELDTSGLGGARTGYIATIKSHEWDGVLGTYKEFVFSWFRERFDSVEVEREVGLRGRTFGFLVVGMLPGSRLERLVHPICRMVLKVSS